MNKTKLMLALVIACAAFAGCTKKDFNAVTGNTEFDSISLSNDSTAYHIVEGADGAVTLAPVATLEPQGAVVQNGLDNMTFAFDDEEIAHLNDDGNLQGYSPGTTNVTVTYVDVDHDFATTTLVIPITVLSAP
jgi:hypothetical protein